MEIREESLILSELTEEGLADTCKHTRKMPCIPPPPPQKIRPSSDHPQCHGHRWSQHKAVQLIRDGTRSQPEMLNFDTRPNFLMDHVCPLVPVGSREVVASGEIKTAEDALGNFPRLSSIVSAAPQGGSTITMVVVLLLL